MTKKTEHKPKWVNWVNIQKKYPEKWLLLGCEKNTSLSQTDSEVLFAGDSNEEAKDFWLANMMDFKNRSIYAMYAFRYIPEQNAKNTKTKSIISVTKKVTKNK
jgi:hypothetical protein